MSDESHIFPSEELLPTVLEGNYNRPLIYDEPDPVNFDDSEGESEGESDVEKSKVDNRVSYNFILREMKKIWNKVIPNWKEKGRRFGTHTGKKTGVAIYVTAGQECIQRDGRSVIEELDIGALCEMFRFCEATCKRHYLRKLHAYLGCCNCRVSEHSSDGKQYKARR